MILINSNVSSPHFFKIKPLHIDDSLIRRVFNDLMIFSQYQRPCKVDEKAI